MNETINSILNRHSTREFEKREIKTDDLDLLMKCALQAPSAKGVATTNIYCITSKSKVAELERMSEEEGKPDCFYSAPVIVLFTGNGGTDHDIRNASAAIENLLVASESMGIGSCWIHRACHLKEDGGHNDFFLSLGMKENEHLMGAVILGYSKQAAPKIKDNSLIHMI